MIKYSITIAGKIKSFRNEKNLSLREFGKLIGVSAQAVCKWEQGICCPDVSLLPHLARMLGCAIDDFFVIYDHESD